MIITHIYIVTKKAIISSYNIHFRSFRSKLSGHSAAQKVKHLRKFTSGFIGSQILNFETSISLSPVTQNSLVPLCKIPFGGPARHKTVEVDQKVKGKLCKRTGNGRNICSCRKWVGRGFQTFKTDEQKKSFAF
jgi:hypothetical protein